MGTYTRVRSFARVRERRLDFNVCDSQYGANTNANNVLLKRRIVGKGARRDQWSVRAADRPRCFSKYNDWVRRRPLLAMVGSLVFIVLLGVFESLRDWVILRVNWR